MKPTHTNITVSLFCFFFFWYAEVPQHLIPLSFISVFYWESYGNVKRYLLNEQETGKDIDQKKCLLIKSLKIQKHMSSVEL